VAGKRATAGLRGLAERSGGRSGRPRVRGAGSTGRAALRQRHPVALKALPEGGVLRRGLRRAGTGRRRTGAAAGHGQGRGQHDGPEHARPGRQAGKAVGQTGQQCLLHWLQAERTWRRAVRDRVSRRLQSTGRVLRFRCGRLRAFCPAARAFSREAAATAVQVPISTLAASGSRTWKAAPCPGWVSTMISPPWAATSEAAIDKPSPAPPRARVRASSVR